MNNETFNRKLTDFPSAKPNFMRREARQHLKKRLEANETARKLNFCNSGLSKIEIAIWGTLTGIMVITSLVYDSIFNKREAETTKPASIEQPVDSIAEFTENEAAANKTIDAVINDEKVSIEDLENLNETYGPITSELNNTMSNNTVNTK